MTYNKPIRTQDVSQDEEKRANLDALNAKAKLTRAALDSEIARLQALLPDTWGDALDWDAGTQTVSLEIDTDKGLEFSSGEVQVNLGDGLETNGSGEITVMAPSGTLQTDGGDLEIDYTGFSSGTADSSIGVLMFSGSTWYMLDLDDMLAALLDQTAPFADMISASNYSARTCSATTASAFNTFMSQVYSDLNSLRSFCNASIAAYNTLRTACQNAGVI